MKKVLLAFILLLTFGLVSCSEDNRYERVMQNYNVDIVIASTEINIDFEYALLLNLYYDEDYTQDSDNLNVDIVFGYNETDDNYSIMYVPERLKYTPIVDIFEFPTFLEVTEAVNEYNINQSYGTIQLLEDFDPNIQFPIKSSYEQGRYSVSANHMIKSPFSVLIGNIQDEDKIYNVQLVINTDGGYSLIAVIDYLDDITPTELFSFII